MYGFVINKLAAIIPTATVTTNYSMITEQYIRAYQDFVKVELSLTSQYNGQEYAKRMAPYYNGMCSHISQHPSDYLVFNDDCDVTYYEMQFVEAVEPIRKKLFGL